MNFNKLFLLTIASLGISQVDAMSYAKKQLEKHKQGSLIAGSIALGGGAIALAKYYSLDQKCKDWIYNTVHGSCDANLLQAQGQLVPLQNQLHIATTQANILQDQLVPLQNQLQVVTTHTNILQGQNTQAQRNYERIDAEKQVIQLQRDDLQSELSQARRALHTQRCHLEASHREEIEAKEKQVREERTSFKNQMMLNASNLVAFNNAIETFYTEADTKLQRLNSRLDDVQKQLPEKPSKVLTSSINSSWSLVNPPSASDKNIDIRKLDSQELARRGKSTLNKLLKNEGMPLYNLSQQEALEKIVEVIHTFYECAVQKGQKFDEGTFVIEDKNFNIYNSLLDYIQKANTEITGITHYDKPLMVSYNPFGYARRSTHFVDKQKEFVPYGIDIRFGLEGTEEALLPAGKRHLLIGKLDTQKQLIYIKPENHGLYYKDGVPGHGHELALAQARKSPMIKNLFSNWFNIDLGSDDAENCRKERVPEKFLNEFAHALIREEILHPSVIIELHAMARHKGIQALFSPLAQRSQALEQLRIRYEISFEYDHPEIRYGREVILTHDELLKACGLPQENAQRL